MAIFDRLKGLFGGVPQNGNADSSDSDVDASGMISCEDALRLVNEYLDGELASAPEDQVRSHFDACERCYPHLQFESAFKEAVRRAAGGQAAPKELRAKLVALLAQADTEG
ncbi:MAG: zf-HC2 domain-containing protein [Gemmatimonadetes bacterium]|nr:zf-HC2 domain-containing protein [Gemmatimonadota bacterium]MDA1103889.1 zf-HC2 domain-containing protein [Gemmatimonadota bacterium]